MKVESVYDIILALDEEQRKELFKMFKQKNIVPQSSFAKRELLIKANLQALKIFNENDTCLTVEEAADWFNVHRNTVVKRLQSGEWKGHLIGRVWRIPKLQFLDKIMNES